MDDPRWLRLVTIGLVLAALAVGYFLMTGKLFSPAKTQSQVSKAVVSPTPSAVLGQNTEPRPLPTSSPTSAYERIASRTQSQIQTLPATGFPAGLAIIFSGSVIIAGYGLRKFPH